ncbi:MAG: phospholipid carrier-dependent glycosyltransferase [Elusimicrobia bacterium]|nr:phospholipid carrier-dependent glycosyltransferase [Elusimicrobiota bacterium]
MKKRVIYILFFIYLIGLGIATYIFNKPFVTNSPVQSIEQFFTTTFFEIIIFCWISILACMLGNWICFKAKCEFDSNLEEFIFSIGIGLGSIAYLIFMLSALKLLYISVGYTFLLILTIFMFRHGRRFLTRINWNINLNLKTVEIILILIIAQHILANFTTALSLPVSACDDLSYHLAVPKIYVQNHGFKYIPYIIHSNWPFLMEMLYTLGFMLTGDAVVPQLFHFLTSVLTLFTIYLFGRKYFSARVGLLASALFYTAFVVRKNAGIAYIDIGLAFFELLAIYAFVNWFYSEQKKWFVLSAVGCGMSLATKLTGVFPLLILSAGIVYKVLVVNRNSLPPHQWLVYWCGGFLKVVRPLIMFCAISITIVSPWFLKSYIHTGNPVWPFAYKIFGGANWSVEYDKRFAVAVRSHGANRRGIVNYFLLPVNFIRYSDDFGYKPQHFFTPFFVYLILFMVFIRKNPQLIKYLLVYSFIYSILFFRIGQETRFLLPVLPVLSLILAFWVEQFYIHKKYIFRICAFFIIIPLVYRFPLTSHSHYKRLPMVLGMETREEYLQRSLAVYPVFSWMNRNLGSDSRILIIGDIRCFYSDLPYVWSCPVSQAYIDYDLCRSVDDFKKRLKELNITHAAVFPYKDLPWPIHVKKLKDSLLKESRLIYENGNMKVYSLN